MTLNSTTDIFWVSLGVAGQIVFGLRFIWQWIVSERRNESVIPVVFWYFSIAGALILLVYTLFRDPVLAPGQLGGLVIYSRNLMLIHRKRKAATAEPIVSQLATDDIIQPRMAT